MLVRNVVCNVVVEYVVYVHVWNVVDVYVLSVCVWSVVVAYVSGCGK
jgi:hypothetical protein